MAKFLMHAYQGEQAAPNLVFRYDDRDYSFPPYEPVEVESDFIAQTILNEQGPIFGLIEVSQKKGRFGVSLDYDAAKSEAENALKMNMRRHVNEWAAAMIKDRVRQNLPALAPTGFVAEAVKALNISIKQRYGFQPIGLDELEDAPVALDTRPREAPESANPGMAAELEDLREQLARAKERVASAEAQSNLLEEELALAKGA